jgi:hypothetical protein
VATLLERLWRAPPGSGRIGTARRRADIRLVPICASLLIDLMLVVVCRESALVRPSALRTFAITNLSLLSSDLIITLAVIRPGFRGAEVAEWLCVTIEALATIVWIQMTGTLSSYFLLMAPFLSAIYRLGAGYRIGLWCGACLSTFHFGAFLLERFGVIPAAPFFVAASPLTASSDLGVIVFVSVQLVFQYGFFGANYVDWTLREKDAALRAAREELRRVLAEGHPGALAGRTIAERFLLTDFLGRGGMGDVYKATRSSDSLVVAVKILHYHLSAERVAVTRFRREVEAARRLVGARVPEVLESGVTDDGLHFFAMEWLRGEDLASLLRRRERLSVVEVQKLADELAEVLDVAHAEGIVHRDVKPQNVFLVEADDGGRRLHLLDFGIASLQNADGIGQVTLAGGIVGTPGYLAPEQVAQSFGDVGPATDVFAMGAVLYRALTGKAPFSSLNDRGAMFAALHAIPDPPSCYLPDLRPDVDAVFAIALAKRPTDRYAKASAFAGDLRCANSSGLSENSRARAKALLLREEAAGPTATQQIDDAIV